MTGGRKKTYLYGSGLSGLLEVGREVGENDGTVEIGDYSGQLEVSQRTQQALKLGTGRTASQYDSVSAAMIKMSGRVCEREIEAQNG